MTTDKETTASIPTLANILKSLVRRERDWSLDLDHARSAWGATDPNTQLRARKLAGCRRAIAERRRMTQAEFAGEV